MCLMADLANGGRPLTHVDGVAEIKKGFCETFREVDEPIATAKIRRKTMRDGSRDVAFSKYVFFVFSLFFC